MEFHFIHRVLSDNDTTDTRINFVRRTRFPLFSTLRALVNRLETRQSYTIEI